MTIKTDSVRISWDAPHRRFKSNRRPPALLHVCQESRREGLKTYQLSFSATTDPARIYFSYDLDILCILWKTLGPLPRPLARKLNDEECAKIKYMLINDEDLLDHSPGEIGRFTGLKSLGVICDPEREHEGSQWGADGIADYFEYTDAFKGSRHWWFDILNERASVPQKQPWRVALAELLRFADEYGSLPWVIL